jgi:hypothetical protein
MQAGADDWRLVPSHDRKQPNEVQAI